MYKKSKDRKDVDSVIKSVLLHHREIREEQPQARVTIKF